MGNAKKYDIPTAWAGYIPINDIRGSELCPDFLVAVT